MLQDEALEYHRRPPHGKVGIAITKPFDTQRDMALAYTPGVAAPVLAIAADPEASFTYTARANLVAVITNGTAVLGLGDVGPAASKPVMEGKAALFKRFADVDVFDLEIDTTDPDEFVAVVRALAPTFGGVNLEDIKAPECFEIEERLRGLLDVPVFHDDQHGTAIIAGAGLLNALEVAGKDIGAVRTVVCGAGAAGLACSEFFLKLGMDPASLVLVDVHGVVHRGRSAGMHPHLERFAADTGARTLAAALGGADVFVGLSVGGLVSGDMLAAMAPDPVVFALANPDPEISYDDARAARPDAIVATGRSDYPNQVNNVLGFPFVFRGALDVRARSINDEMKIAACRALRDLAREEVPLAVLHAYGVASLSFGRDYLIPKALDPRVPLRVPPAVAAAAMASGVARTTVDLADYREELARRFVPGRGVLRTVVRRARTAPCRVVFSEGEEPRVIRAAEAADHDGLARPVLLGRHQVIEARMGEMRIEAGGIEIVDPHLDPRRQAYAEAFASRRQRKGVTGREAAAVMEQPNYFGTMMVRRGDAEAFVAGLTYHYPDVIRPALQVIGCAPGVTRVAAMHLMLVGDRPYVFTDTTVNIDPTAEEVADIAVMAADQTAQLGLEPRLALLSFSNFGSTRHPRAAKMAEAAALVRRRRPDLEVDGEVMADVAVDAELRADYPFSALRGNANVLVFPSLEAANTAYKLVHGLGGATAVGPILMGMAQPVHVLARGAEVSDIVNITAVAVVDAQRAAGAGR
ncbi:MAG TPA: NADP-dependent malic enzyme [Acidimicrobiales bacterium]|nr:NADP-dependent malic enzyme [Acidimicrobiales bacterium]